MSRSQLRFKKIKDHFEEMAKGFDKNFPKIVPLYKQAIEALISALPFEEDKRIKVLDLGCGTGNITRALIERYPNASVMCVDLAENMLKMAKAKLKKHKKIEYWLGDVRKFDYSKQYDAIISSFVMHHVDKKEKMEFYGKIFNALSNEGVFYNNDFVLGAGNYLQKMFIDKWKIFMLKYRSPAEIKKTIAIYHKEDRPAKMLHEIAILDKVGFCNIDIVWKYYNFAVYGGQKFRLTKITTRQIGFFSGKIKEK